jgi:hypothetical protein
MKLLEPRLSVYYVRSVNHLVWLVHSKIPITFAYNVVDFTTWPVAKALRKIVQRVQNVVWL